ncbi:GNAT family N-acetyltransferase [Marinimicrococcus flavescens]|uniref:GNAT family N-acetyltransferase n=1 Tax=Marinimicrococcus flavescens TaxID=3031815 RepID=A0AAP3XRV0_9PROT|nr:GNAT family N-acetyltransferase [Marinimicrococcus flavescens]
MKARWRAMRTEDLAAVEQIALIVHPDYPEDIAIPRERLALFPQGCRVARDEAGAIIGYAVAHPGLLGAPPPLDSLLGALPAAPDCLYLHDVALLPAARGAGLGAALVAELHEVAAGHRLPLLALVAVGNAAPYWQRQGFALRHPEPALAAKLASYGDGAAYMTAAVMPRTR